MIIYPRIVAHRCGGALAPENTLAGLRLAARLGCRGVEFDAMLSADGIPVLVHDETLDRTTDACGGVAERDAAGLARVDAGCRHHAAFAGEPLPMLDAALRLCAELGLWANVEIKPSHGCEAETGRVVARASALARSGVLLSSFSPAALRAAAAEAGEVPRALLVGNVDADWRQQLDAVGAQALHASARGLNPETIAEVRAVGVPLACYTLNRRDEAESLLAQGVAAVFSDRPDLWAPDEM